MKRSEKRSDQRSAMNRRQLLRLGAFGTTLGGLSALFPTSARALRQGGGWIGGVPQNKLLVVFLRGGNDGTNTIFPWGDSDYAMHRGPLTLDPVLDGIDIGSNVCSLHGAFAQIQPILDAGDAVLIQRVGYASSSRSHFDAQQIWESAYAPTSGSLDRFGFLGRYVQQIATPSNPLPIAAFENEPPLSFVATDRSLPQVPRLEEYVLEDVDLLASQTDAYDEGETAVERDGRILFQSMGEIATLLPGYDPAALSSRYPANADGAHFREAAYVLGHSDCNAATVSLGGFDTHTDQLARHANRLGALASCLRGVYDDATASGLWPNLAVLVISEFGRQGRANGSLPEPGTDHGGAGASLVLGGGVAGGTRACDPSTYFLDGLGASPMAPTDGAMTYRTDFRAIYAEILDRHLGMSQAQIDAIIPSWLALSGSGDPAFDYVDVFAP